MCAICGCEGDHDHDHHHHHDHPHPHPQVKRLAVDLLAKNDRAAERNRGWLRSRGIAALNLMGTPGAGKTTLLERTIRRLFAEMAIGVLEGDQETDRDAARIRATGAPVVQVNTGAGCHLDAEMVFAGLAELPLPSGALLMIENVGNLVCPAMFDLGERAKVVVMSTTEGEDKPLKYPHMFRAADLLVINKIDLVPHLEIDLDALVGNAKEIKPELDVLQVSATRDVGLDAWCRWIRARVPARREMRT